MIYGAHTPRRVCPLPPVLLGATPTFPPFLAAWTHLRMNHHRES